MIGRDSLCELLDFDPETGSFRWRESGRGRNNDQAGSVAPNGYRQITIAGEKYQAHRLVVLWLTGEMPVCDVDHINGDRSDNRPSNLRCVSRAENMQNQHKLQVRNKSGVRGVVWHKAASKWAARIGRKHIGLFDSVECAAAARKLAELAVFTKPVSEFA